MVKHKLDTEVEILGTKYNVKIMTEEDEPRLKTCDGFADKTSYLIAVGDNSENGNLDKPLEYLKKVIRHEVIHAFMFESGLESEWKHEQWGHDETVIDWFAIQMPKMIPVIEQIYQSIEEVKT